MGAVPRSKEVCRREQTRLANPPRCAAWRSKATCTPARSIVGTTPRNGTPTAAHVASATLGSSSTSTGGATAPSTQTGRMAFGAGPTTANHLGRVVKLVDTPGLKPGPARDEGSTPSTPTLHGLGPVAPIWQSNSFAPRRLSVRLRPGPRAGGMLRGRAPRPPVLQLLSGQHPKRRADADHCERKAHLVGQ